MRVMRSAANVNAISVRQFSDSVTIPEKETTWSKKYPCVIYF